MPYGLLSRYGLYCLVLVVVTAIVFVVHAYPLRFVFLEVVGMCSVHAVRRAVCRLSNKKSALTLTYILFVRVVARFHAEHPTHLGSICIDLRFAIGRVRCHT